LRVFDSLHKSEGMSRATAQTRANVSADNANPSKRLARRKDTPKQAFERAGIYIDAAESVSFNQTDAMESPQIVPSPAPAQLPPQDPAQLPPPDPAQLAPVEPDFRPACKPKKRGRGRGMGHTFFDQILYGQNGCKIVVRLEAPAPGEECPLTLSPIAEDSLEFLQPTTAYLTAFPAYKKMTLPCGHGFGALSILYHFARRNMLCPCCRRGSRADCRVWMDD
jgi:hypothetical protein